MSEETWTKWVQPADDLLRQAYYRILGMVSFHAPLSESIKAAQYLAESTRGGKITYWGRTAIPGIPLPVGRIFNVYSWDGCEIYPGIKMDLWIYGTEKGSNTVYVRKRWYRFYIVEKTVAMLATRTIELT